MPGAGAGFTAGAMTLDETAPEPPKNYAAPQHCCKGSIQRKGKREGRGSVKSEGKGREGHEQWEGMHVMGRGKVSYQG